ncbi:MAG TPA: thiolase family protein [Candidatus Binatia bacterium]|jgi:acetyl-CoA acetyltransferase|nr:thiolase family protein [Candidatus Binatia bacterium]
MRDVAILGVGMTRFGKFLERSLKELAREAVDAALASAGLGREAVQAAVVGNAMAGLMSGQECVRGQVVLREIGIGGIPVVNTENACASSSTALHLGWLWVASGLHDVVLVLGMEKLFHADKQRSFRALAGAADVDAIAAYPETRSMFMDYYADLTRAHMRRFGTTPEQFAAVAVKNHWHGSLNPNAQYRNTCTVDEVLASPMIVEPLTRLMCSPIGDGAAALVVVAGERARRVGGRPVWMKASVIGSCKERGADEPEITERVAGRAYEMAGIGPDDVDVVELHDGSAPAEVIAYEHLGLCPAGEGGRLVADGETALGGRIPVNPSGGLIARGHPVGATGAAQVCELVWQLRGEADRRQVPGARVGLAHNGGGLVQGESAATVVHVLAT